MALAYKFKEFEAEKAKNRQLANLKQFSEEETSEVKQSTVSPLVDIRESNQGRILEVIAKMAGVGRYCSAVLVLTPACFAIVSNVFPFLLFSSTDSSIR